MAPVSLGPVRAFRWLWDKTSVVVLGVVFRITEGGVQRLTEEGVLRITEGQ